MHLIVDSTPGMEWRSVQPLFEPAGFQVAAESATQEWLVGLGAALNDKGQAARMAERLFGMPGKAVLLPVAVCESVVPLEHMLEQLEDSKLLLLYEPVETVLLRAMANGEILAETFQEWRGSVHRMLELYRSNRRRTVLLNVESVLRNPGEFGRACQEHFGTQGEVPVPGNHLPSENHEEIHRVIAAQYVAQSDDAQDLANELEASSIPLGPYHVPEKIDCESAFRSVNEMDASALDDLKGENELLLLQLHQVQEELESYYLRLVEQTQAGDKLKRESAKAAADNRKAAELLAKSEKALGVARSELGKLKVKVKTLYEQERAKHRKLRAIYDSTSWKVTRPLRLLGRLLKRKPVREA